MAIFQAVRYRVHSAAVCTLLVASVFVVAAAANPDEASCAPSEPAAGSALMQMRTGSPKHPKRAQGSEKAAGRSVAAEPERGEPSGDMEDGSEQVPGESAAAEPERREPSDDMEEAVENEDYLPYQAYNEDFSNQAEDAAGVSETREQREQGNGKKAHAKSTKGKSNEEDFSFPVEKEDPNNQAEAAAEFSETIEQREQGNDKKKHAKKARGKSNEEGFSFAVEKQDPNNQAEVAAGASETAEQLEEDAPYQAEQKDSSNQAEITADGVPEIEQGNGKKEHTKNAQGKSNEEDLAYQAEPEGSSDQAEVASDIAEKRDEHEQVDVKKEKAKHGKGKPQKKGADVSKLASKIGPNGACKSHPCRLTNFNEKERNLGSVAGLDEVGYQKVAALKDDAEMAEYVARVIDKCDFKVGNMKGMMALVPWFSGTTAAQSFEALEDALLSAALVGAEEPWLMYRNSAEVSGDNAELGVVGYVQVAALRDGTEMNKFAKRLCKQMGVKIEDESAFDSTVESYVGSDGFQSFERLQAELRSAANAPNTWAKWGKRQASLASTQHVLSAGASAFERAAVRVSTRGFCTRHPCRSLLAARSKPSGRGKLAPLDEAGYQQVARLQDDKEMRDFIMRVIAMYDCKVSRDGGLSGIVPWFSGTTEVQSFEKLEEVLLFAIISDPKNAWINYRNTARVSGENAPLSLTGYVQVAAIRSTTEMKKFARRLCKDLGVKIVNEGGFEGMVNYYSGSQNFQSYERLVSEIKSAARAPNSWARRM